VTLVLEHCNGNRTNAAKILHLDRKTLYRKLVRWGLASK
jgi:DNA-binding protein Fis